MCTMGVAGEELIGKECGELTRALAFTPHNHILTSLVAGFRLLPSQVCVCRGEMQRRAVMLSYTWNSTTSLTYAFIHQAIILICTY